MDKDYSEWEDMLDVHASSRDRKKERKEIDRRMRGNRSVFTIQETIIKRARKHGKETK